MTASNTLKMALLDRRGVIRVGGPDARPLLQGIISNDVDKVTPTQTIWAALLTPQGKYLHDFFVCQINDDLYLDCELDRRDDLLARLRRFKLRSDVAVKPADVLQIAAFFQYDGAHPWSGQPAGEAQQVKDGCIYVDPRLSSAGARALAPKDTISALAEKYGANLTPSADQDIFRITLGLPDGSRDISVEKSVLLEAGFDELNGIDWHKGCYMGQEVTARTYHRGLVKRRLVPVHFEGTTPATATPLFADDKEVGVVASTSGQKGLAMLRIEAIDPNIVITAGGTRVIASKPDWVNIRSAG